MTNFSPLVSVVIPTFNRENVLGRAISSVIKQSYQNIELIVVDDGSTDNTAKLVKEQFPQTKYFKTINKGVSAARNYGVKKSLGEYIAFLDSDDEWMPKKIQKQLDEIQRQGVRWIHGEERWIRNGVRVNQKKIHQKSGGDIFNRSLHLCLISPSTVMLEKSLFEEFNGFDESFIVCEDFDLWLRILFKYPIGFVTKEVIFKYGGHEDQLSAKYKAMDEYRVKTYEKLISLHQITNERRSELMMIADRKCKILISGYRKHGHYQKAELIEEKRNWFKQQLDL